ncbi:MAG: hypothetical protein ICV55_03315 [Coleofasciculus sp. C3-bin4]|nr:hypothetical protein [Coleofasciculus sp. C3-bin4]
MQVVLVEALVQQEQAPVLPVPALFWKLEGLAVPLQEQVQTSVPNWEREQQVLGVALEQAGKFLAFVLTVLELSSWEPNT